MSCPSIRLRTASRMNEPDFESDMLGAISPDAFTFVFKDNDSVVVFDIITKIGVFKR